MPRPYIMVFCAVMAGLCGLANLDCYRNGRRTGMRCRGMNKLELFGCCLRFPDFLSMPLCLCDGGASQLSAMDPLRGRAVDHSMVHLAPLTSYFGAAHCRASRIMGAINVIAHHTEHACAGRPLDENAHCL